MLLLLLLVPSSLEQITGMDGQGAQGWDGGAVAPGIAGVPTRPNRHGNILNLDWVESKMNDDTQQWDHHSVAVFPSPQSLQKPKCVNKNPVMETAKLGKKKKTSLISTALKVCTL